MTAQSSWPGKNNPIAKIRYSLMKGFDASGNPEYVGGFVDSSQEREEVQSLLAGIHPSPLSIASVTMGEVVLELRDGTTVTLRPVFHPSRNRYADLFMTQDAQYPLPPRLAELFDRWRGGA